METYNSYITINNSDSFFSSQAMEKNVKPPPAYHSALHSVRKFPAKNIIIKKPMNSPLPPTCPKIYKVDPIDFRDVVQRLTGAAEFQTTRLQEAAPPPLSLSPPQTEEEDDKPRKPFESNFGAISSPIGFSLSPSSLAWCSSFISSPRTLSSLEPSAAL